MAEDRPAPPPGRDLPALYQDPWSLLGRDLRAVLASTRLRLWELARRNRQGDLAVPEGWPSDLRPWFWPLVLGLALVAVVALSALLPPSFRPAPPPPPSSAAPAAAPAGTAGAELPESPAPPAPPTSEAATEPVSGPGSEVLPEPPAPVPDPLLALLAATDPDRLIVATRERPAGGCLALRLAAAFTVLAPAAQLQQAERWQRRALELGYERLELVDGAGRLLGRSALVGSGMILLSSAAPPPDGP